ncbi:STAS domain-containing protein [Micromonosporaceae bacterium Da 78-11]
MSLAPSQVTSPVQLRIQTWFVSPGSVRITVAGEIDLATTEELQAGLLHVLVTRVPHHIEVDLTRVTFMDCRGLTVFVIASQTAARTGCRLHITNPQSIVRRILEITGLISILTPHPTGHLSYRPAPTRRT